METLPANNAADFVQSRTTEKTINWTKKAVTHAKQTGKHPLSVIFRAVFKD